MCIILVVVLLHSSTHTNYGCSSVTDSFIGFDRKILMSEEWQTVLKYLDSHRQGADDKKHTYTINEDDFTSPTDALELLIA